tara:strand:+ start:1296 stop:1496 length:201 start_codon:yes stop_codon:yes gene_type:complete
MPNKRNILKINIWGAPNKLNPNRHPAGGYYKHPSHDPANQPKKTPRQRKIEKNYKFPKGKNIRDIA